MNEGAITLGSREITDLPSAKRDIAMVFQNYALYQHMNVRKNMAFGLSLNGMPAAEIDARVKNAAEILRITDLLDRKPRQLSGGQRQRVAIGRAITRQPQLFLLDEPLSNLNASLRVTMRAELSALHDRLLVTMIYVTHDQVEAMTLSDRGRRAGQGPRRPVRPPAGAVPSAREPFFVAGFIGSPQMNFLTAKVEGQTADSIALSLPGGSITVPTAGHGPVDPRRPVTLGIRPDRLELGTDGPLTGTVRLAERLGTENHLHIDLQAGGSVVVITDGTHPARARDAVHLRIPAADAHVFDAEGFALPRHLGAETEALISEPTRPAEPA